MLQGTRLFAWLATVVASMVVLFTVPPDYFVAATFVATICMLAAAYNLGAIKRSAGPVYLAIGIGAASAGILYLIFYAGGAAVDAFHPLGVTSASESSIYSLIASPGNPVVLQAGVLLFDSAGYEAFFRGVLQERVQSRLGVAGVPLVALADAGLHIITLNPIWVGGTFVTDLIWGLTYYWGSGLTASFTSHFLWDLAIFVVHPVK